MIKKYAVITGLLLSFIMAFQALGQSLPEIPDIPDFSTPPLTDEEIIPQKVVPEKGPLGKDQNAATKKKAVLDEQFQALKRMADVEEASLISGRIQGLWEQSGSETVDLLMQSAADAIRKKDYAAAMDFLDNVVALEPNFAEGWMRRAALHVQMNDLALAMLDISWVLKVEPRQYNAIALIGIIMEVTGRKKLALDAYRKALDIYPQMIRAQARLSNLLEEETARAL